MSFGTETESEQKNESKEELSRGSLYSKLRLPKIQSTSALVHTIKEKSWEYLKKLASSAEKAKEQRHQRRKLNLSALRKVRLPGAGALARNEAEITKSSSVEDPGAGV